MGSQTLGYSRPSARKGAPGLDRQREAIAGYCAARSWPFDPAAQLFADVAEARRLDLALRTAGGALWARLRRGDRLVVATLDLLFRGVPDAAGTLDRWRDLGIELHVVDLGGPVHLLGAASAALAMADLERAARAERAAAAAAESGSRRRPVNGQSAFGTEWRRRPGTGAWYLAEHAEERALMGRMLDWHEAGWSVDQIRQHLAYTLRVKLYRRRGRSKHLVSWTTDAIWRRIQAEARLRQQEADASRPESAGFPS